jgi:opacity protein-like surface antigen
MKLSTAVVALAALAAASGSAGAEGLAWNAVLEAASAPAIAPLAPHLRYGSGLKDMAVPAPIPVPAPVPVPEGFTYYLRADLGYGWALSGPSFSESGNLFGDAAAPPFAAVGGAFGYGHSPEFGALGISSGDVLMGTIGFGAYLTPRFRGDITLDFRGKPGYEATRTYTYTSGAGDTVNGTVKDTFKVRGTVAMINGYLDILPRGRFTPYIGAGIGFVYNDIDRTHYNQEVVVAGLNVNAAPVTYNAAGKNNDVGLAAALMAGVTFAFDHRWALDVNYRAQYLDIGSVDLTPSGQLSKATFEELWEHQVRVGVRVNIW